ncbi:cytochrome P450, partial [Angustibacter aerolatus]
RLQLLRDAVRGARADPASAGPAVAAVAAHRDADGRLLDERTAAVELHNVVRPTVAVSWLVTYAATAIGHEPRLRERLAHGAPEDTEAFAHEVRRRYPFVPVLGALARKGFSWGGVDVHEGDLVLLDVHGSHHDPQVWPQPGRLDLDRFHGREPGPFELLAQGGGDARTGHRCPGERLTVELLRDASVRLARTPYHLSGPRDVSLRRMPPAVLDVRIETPA